MTSPWNRAYYSLRWLKRLLALWRHPNRRFLAYPPGHFASPLPDHAAVERDHSRLMSVENVPGIELHVGEQIELLRTIAPLAKRIEFPERPTVGFRFHFENAFFTYGDAVRPVRDAAAPPTAARRRDRLRLLLRADARRPRPHRREAGVDVRRAVPDAAQTRC